jgi:putative cardiolipin synthase
LLTDLAQRGVRVEVLTNSLAATDLFSVHAAYSHYRRPLLHSGARLFEFAPPPRAPGRRDLLHSKIFLIDGMTALVGSHNFDMRSAYINIELGLLFHEPTLVAELSELFDRQTAPSLAFSVTLEDGQLHWEMDKDTRPGRQRYEPEASMTRRAISWIIRRVPHDWF